MLQRDPVAFARAVLGQEVPADVTVAATEYLSRSVKGDGLLVTGAGSLLQVEAQAQYDPGLGLRLVEYLVGGLRRYSSLPDLYIVLLHPAADRYSHDFNWSSALGTRIDLKCHIVKMWELPPDRLASEPALAPLLSLTAASSLVERAQRLANVLRGIRSETERSYREDASLWATMLATLYLSKQDVSRIHREAGMTVQLRDLPGGQWLLEEGREEGRMAMAMSWARARFGDDPIWLTIRDLDGARLDEIAVLLAAGATTSQSLRDWLS